MQAYSNLITHYEDVMKKKIITNTTLEAAFTHVLGYISSVSQLTPLVHTVSMFACTFCLYLLVFYMIACILSTRIFCIRLCLSYIWSALRNAMHKLSSWWICFPYLCLFSLVACVFLSCCVSGSVSSHKRSILQRGKETSGSISTAGFHLFGFIPIWLVKKSVCWKRTHHQLIW